MIVVGVGDGSMVSEMCVVVGCMLAVVVGCRNRNCSCPVWVGHMFGIVAAWWEVGNWC